MFSEGTKRGNMLSVEIMDNGYLVAFTVVENGKLETKRLVTDQISTVLGYVSQFNALPKL